MENILLENSYIKNILDDNCPICLELNGEVHKNHQLEYEQIINMKDNVIWSNNIFSILASIGPLNDSHLLIVPNSHILSMSELSIAELIVLDVIKRKIREVNLLYKQQSTEFFEHGSSCINTGGACINHAHIHAICTNISIYSKIKSKLELRKIDFVSLNFEHQNRDTGYLYYEDIYGNSYIDTDTIIQSQYLRKCYMDEFNRQDQWDWRKFNNIDIVTKIISDYKKYLGSYVVNV